MDNLSAVEAIFFKALDQRSPEERAAYLDQACGQDLELRRCVERLLSAQPKVGSFLEPPLPGTVDEPPPAEGPGTRIGPYKLLQQIGEGGMGVVYMAEQEVPVRRKVALKIIKPGMDSAEVLARFEAERQALALMDHPNIAKVLDAGTTDNGRPYFVMELVHGVPITQFCDDNRLTPRERLELFVPVCQAIQHAHQKGIIHRDLKPSNVLVTMYDAKPVPKVIDFGVAKAAGLRLTERTLFTRFGAFVGTLEYMSPEQAGLNAVGVDTRSDIYALGVLLYELLTGTTPLERKRLRQAALDELVRLIREEEPPRPSVRLSGSDTLPKIAAARQTEPARLSRLVQGDLDWIVMKCLEKDRTRRYEAASALARDVERYLHDEPVEACPPSAGYRVRKFLRRNRTAVAAGVTFFVLLTAGLVVSTWQAFRATRAEWAAFTLKEKSEQAHMAESEARKRAELQAFVVQFQERRQRLQGVDYGISADEERHERLRGAFLGLAGLLRTVPDHAPTWRDHLVMTVLLAGRRFEPPPILPDRPDFAIQSIAVSPDGQRVLAATDDGTLQVRDFPSLAFRCALHDKWSGPWEGFGFLPGNKVVWTSAEGQVRLWDATTGQAIGQPLPHPGRVEDVLPSPDGTRLLTRGNAAQSKARGLVQLWDARTARRIALLEGPERSVNEIAFRPDGSQVVAAGEGALFVWSAPDGKLLRRIAGIDEFVYGLAFNPSGRVLAVCTRNHLHWLQTEDWSRTTVALGIRWPSAEDYQIRLSWAAGTDELVHVRGQWHTFAASGKFEVGDRVGSPVPLGFAPHAVRGSFVLAHKGDVYELGSGRRIVPSKGRKYPDEARRFAIGGRWLQLPDELIDLGVEQPLPVDSAEVHRVGRSAVGWALVYSGDIFWASGTQVWPLPARPEALAPEDVAFWAELLACSELGPDGQSRALDEAECEARRRRLAAKTPPEGGYRLPGFDVNDRHYWLRTELERTADNARKRALFDRLVAEEPRWRNYRSRAMWRGETGDYAGSLADQLEAGKLAGPIFWKRFPLDAAWGFKLAFNPDRPRGDYQRLLEWAEHRNDDLLRGLALYRLERFADAVKLLEPVKFGKGKEDGPSMAVLVRAMAR